MTVHEAIQRLTEIEDENMAIAVHIITPAIIRNYGQAFDLELSDEEVSEILALIQKGFDNTVITPAWINEWMLIDAIEKVKGVVIE